MHKTARPKYRNYTEIGAEAHELKLRLLDELGVSNNTLTEMAIRALAADRERRRPAEPAA